MFSSQKYGVSLVKVKVTVAILDSLYVEKVVIVNQLLNFCLCNNAGTYVGRSASCACQGHHNNV